MGIEARAGSRQQEIAAEFRQAAEVLFVDSPLYRAVCREVADAPAVLRLAALAQPGQSAVLLMLAAVHERLLAGVDHPLARAYAGTHELEPRALGEMFVDLCRAHEDAIAAFIRSGRVQTNEVGRALYLRVAAEWLALIKPEQSLSWLELGASAGLNLLWDEFETAYVRDEREYVRGSPDSGVRLECKLEGKVSPLEVAPSGGPIVAERVGLEITPPDLARAEDVSRLLAFVWADHRARLNRTRAAIELRRSRPVEVRCADATTQLLRHARGMRSDTLMCVVHSFFTSQLPPALCERVDEQLALLSNERAVARIAIEWVHNETRAFVELWQDGCVERTWLCRGQPHGRSIEWLADVPVGVST